MTNKEVKITRLESFAESLSEGHPVNLDLDSESIFRWQNHVPIAIEEVWDILPREGRLAVYVMAMELARAAP